MAFFFRQNRALFGPFCNDFKIQLWHSEALYGLHIVYRDGYGIETCYVYGCLTIWYAADKRHTYFDLMTQFLSKILNFLDVPVVRIHIYAYFWVHMYVVYVLNPSDVNYTCLWCIGSYSYTCLWKLIFSKFPKSENSKKTWKNPLFFMKISTIFNVFENT